MTPAIVKPSVTIPWVESPFFEEELAKAQLDAQTEAMVRSYADDGYLIFDPGIDENVIDAAREDLIPKFGSGVRLQDAWQTDEPVRQIATAPKVLDTLRFLYRREPIPFQTLNFNVGTQQRTHSDTIHFDSIPQRFMCGVWVALEEVHEGNGPLHYYTGSHKFPIYNLVDMGLKGSAAQSMEETYGVVYKSYEDFIEAFIKARKLKKDTLRMKKGQAIIWSANLLHGGERITQPGSTRHSQVTHYYFEDCAYYTPLLSDMVIERIYLRKITNIATGQPVVNRYMNEEIKQENQGYSQKMYLPAVLGSLLPKSLKGTIKRLIGRK